MGTTELLLFGFLKVTVRYSVQVVDVSVGIMHSYVDDWEIIDCEVDKENNYSNIEDFINDNFQNDYMNVLLENKIKHS